MATEGLLNCVFEASIVASDMEIDQRPYHRNCNCPLHKKTTSRICGRRRFPGTVKISYPVRHSWSENCLVMQQPLHASPSPSLPPPPPLPVVNDMPSFRRPQSQGSLKQLAYEDCVSWEF